MTDQPLVTLGWSAISWIEHYLIHGPGDVQGQAVELDDEFASFILKAYRLDPKTGQRRVRRAFLSRSKGRSKSGLAAMIECFEAIGPCRFDHWAEPGEVSTWGYEYDEGEPVGKPLAYVECLNVATEEGQAGNTYDAVYYMLHPETCSEELLEDYGHLDVGLSRILLPNSRGFIEPVTSADTSKDGGKSTYIVADETHLWVLPRLKRLHQIMVRNLLKRKLASGWMLETSTMYGEGEGSVAEGTHAYAKTLSTDARRAAALLFDHRQASMDWDLSKRKERLEALREAYGPAAEWMNLDAIADAYDDPQTNESEWRRYWLNQPVPMMEKPPSILPKWGDREDASLLMPERLTIALAGSVDGQWGSIGSAGMLHDGRVAVGAVDRRRGQDWLVAEAKRIQNDHGFEIVLDKGGPLSHLKVKLDKAGVRYAALDTEELCDACASFEQWVNDDDKLVHPGHPDIDDAVEVAGWRTVGQRKAFGRKHDDISMLEAVALAAHYAQSARESVYESRGLVTL